MPEPETPVMTTSLFRGMVTSTFLRLCSRAPWTTILSLGMSGGASRGPEMMLCYQRTVAACERIGAHKPFALYSFPTYQCHRSIWRACVCK